MATLTEVRIGLKERFASIDKLSAYAISPASPKYPAAWSYPTRVDYDQTFDGKMLYTLTVVVAVFNNDIGQAQTNLDPYIAPDGAKSIKAAIEADPTLGGIADYVTVGAMTGYSVMQIGGQEPVGATFEVKVLA